MNNFLHNGYYLKEINYNKGIFDESIDCTYIIHLIGNGRMDNIKKELSYVKPTKKCFILLDEGFKKGNKLNKNIKNCNNDLDDSFVFICNHAYENNYNNILIHEDDFFYDEKILDINIQSNINTFIKNFDNKESMIYNLGAVGKFKKYNNNHKKIIFGVCSHSIIYNKKAFIYVKDNLNKQIDTFLNNIVNKFTYNIPLCYQTFPETENQNIWLNCNLFKSSILNKSIVNLKKVVMFKILNIDTKEGAVKFFKKLYKLSIL